MFQCWHAVTDLHNCTSPLAKNNEGSLLTLKSLLEIMLDETVRFPAAVQTCLQRGSEAGMRQGLTLVHFSAEPEPLLTENIT